METIIYKIDKQQGPTVEHRELYSIPGGKRKKEKKNIYIYICILFILNFFLFSQFYWDIIDIQNCISLRYTAQWFDLHASWSDYHSKFSEHVSSHLGIKLKR